MHLALCSLAAGLGLEVDLSAVAPDSPAYTALYADAAGRFLVSVAPAHQARFEKLFQGQPLYRLGEVRGDKTFKISRGQQTLPETSLDTLQSAWQRRFGKLI